MKISHRGLYALKALIHLAEAYDGGLVKIHQIADEESIPEKFLEGILVTLKNARIVSSQRGREGGYQLRRPPAEILVGGRGAPRGRAPRALWRRRRRVAGRPPRCGALALSRAQCPAAGLLVTSDKRLPSL